jgi:hypothetical protein
MLNPLNAGTNREEFRAPREKSLGSLLRKVGSRTPAYLYPLERAVQWGAAIPVLKQDNHEMQKLEQVHKPFVRWKMGKVTGQKPPLKPARRSACGFKSQITFAT